MVPESVHEVHADVMAFARSQPTPNPIRVCTRCITRYFFWMASQRITISVPREIAQRVRRAAGGGSLSEWVAKSVTRTLEEEDLERKFLEFCDQRRATRADQRWVDKAFEHITGQSSRRSSRGKKAA